MSYEKPVMEVLRLDAIDMVRTSGDEEGDGNVGEF